MMHLFALRFLPFHVLSKRIGEIETLENPGIFPITPPIISPSNGGGREKGAFQHLENSNFTLGSGGIS